MPAVVSRGQDGATFVASVSTSTVALGDTVILSLDFSGADQTEEPKLPPIQDVVITSLGPSAQRQTSIEMINGRMKRMESVTVSFRFALTPKSLGSFTIPSIAVKSKGREYATDPVAVQVVEAVQQDHVRITVEADKAEVFVGEQVTVTVKFFFDDPKRIVGYDRCSIPWLLNLEGFVVEPAEDFLKGLRGEGHMAVDGVRNVPFEVTVTKDLNRGKDYTVYSLSKPMFAASHGARPIPPCVFKCQYAVGARRTSDFFFGPQLIPQDVKDLFVRSNEAAIKVNPLPLEGRPQGFADAVGEYQMEVSVEPATVRRYDPVTVKTRVFGEGDVQGIKSPRLLDTTGFKVYAGEERVSASREGGRVAGTKFFATLLEPQLASLKEVPPVVFVFFSPRQKRYVTLEKGPFAISVLTAEADSVAAGGPPQPPVAVKDGGIETGREIMPIAMDAGGLWNQRGSLWAKRLLILTPMPWVVAAGGLLVRRRYRRLRESPGLVRAARAMRIAKARLAEAQRAATAGDGREYYGLIARAVVEFIADKRNLPPAMISGEAIRGLLLEHGVSQEVADAVSVLLANCDHARFSADGVAEIAQLLNQANGLLSRLDETL